MRIIETYSRIPRLPEIAVKNIFLSTFLSFRFWHVYIKFSFHAERSLHILHTISVSTASWHYKKSMTVILQEKILNACQKVTRQFMQLSFTSIAINQMSNRQGATDICNRLYIFINIKDFLAKL